MSGDDTVSKVSAQMKDALRAKDSLRLMALRSIRALFLTEMKKDNSKTLPKEVCVTLLRRLEKQRRESIEAFDQAGREEQATAEREELAVIQEFLPQLADEDATRTWVREAIESSGASQAGDLGRVMGAVMKAHKGEVDGALARRIASELLSD
ncbi:MAG: GatB/YqeY domain-containing protein [Myxococcota bacterium]